MKGVQSDRIFRNFVREQVLKSTAADERIMMKAFSVLILSSQQTSHYSSLLFAFL